LPSPSPQAEEIPARKKPRVEEQERLPTTTDEAAKKTASPDDSAGLPTSATPPSTPPVNALTRLQSRRQAQIQLPPIETSESERDGDDDVADHLDDDGDMSDAAPPPDATVNAPTRPRSSRRVILASTTGTPLPPPSTTTVDVSTRRQSATWDARFSELAKYRTIHGDCNVPRGKSENTKLAYWVAKQRSQYQLRIKGKYSYMTLSRIQALDSLGFEWDRCGGPWEVRLGELTEYRTIHGDCNVPKRYSENTKLAYWVGTQRQQYRFHIEGKNSYLTLSRIQELESMGFEWDCLNAAWDDRLSDLTDYRKLHGHCNVPRGYSENTKLAKWVSHQRTNYKLHLDGKTSSMTLPRIQELESLGFAWNIHSRRGD
jgi:hypothetical protein